MPEIAVVGTGMAGCGTAYRLHTEGITPVLYDKNTYHGGHTASFRVDGGLLFDVGPHISYTQDPGSGAFKTSLPTVLINNTIHSIST